VIAFGDNQFLEKSVADPEDLREIRRRFAVTWVDVEGLGDVAAVQRLGEIFGLHSLALEDVVNTHQRAKVDHYGWSASPGTWIPSRSPCSSARTLW
jgi:magnesium transporter